MKISKKAILAPQKNPRNSTVTKDTTRKLSKKHSKTLQKPTEAVNNKRGLTETISYAEDSVSESGART